MKLLFCLEDVHRPKTIFLILLILVMPFPCKKKTVHLPELPPPHENGYIWLRNVQSLSLIKKIYRVNGKFIINMVALPGGKKAISPLANFSFNFILKI